MKKPGRPRLDPADRTVPISFGLPQRQYDALCRQALREGVSLPMLVRQALSRRILKMKTPPP
jgi:hypothetical protein